MGWPTGWSPPAQVLPSREALLLQLCCVGPVGWGVQLGQGVGTGTGGPRPCGKRPPNAEQGDCRQQLAEAETPWLESSCPPSPPLPSGPLKGHGSRSWESLWGDWQSWNSKRGEHRRGGGVPVGCVSGEDSPGELQVLGLLLLLQIRPPHDQWRQQGAQRWPLPPWAKARDLKVCFRHLEPWPSFGALADGLLACPRALLGVPRADRRPPTAPRLRLSEPRVHIGQAMRGQGPCGPRAAPGAALAVFRSALA